MTDLLRRALATVIRGPGAAGTVAALDRLIPRRSGNLTVLTYHRIDEPEARPDLTPSLLSATPAAFAAQMAMIARTHQPVSMSDVLAAIDDPKALPQRAVLVTVDDGYRDFATKAWPILKAASVPATLFVATAYADDPTRPFWWDRLWNALRSTVRSDSIQTPLGPLTMGADGSTRMLARIRGWLKSIDHDQAMRQVELLVAELGEPAPPAPAVLTWDELRALAGEGVTLAPHTRDHPLLDRVSPQRAVTEIAGSWADLDREIGAIAAVPRVLAYPSGAHGGPAVAAARQAGMRLALTTERGSNQIGLPDRFRLRRLNVGRRTSTTALEAQLIWAGAMAAHREPVSR